MFMRQRLLPDSTHFYTCSNDDTPLTGTAGEAESPERLIAQGEAECAQEAPFHEKAILS